MALLCAAPYPSSASRGGSGNWSGWQVMFKSGNMDLSQGLCPRTGMIPQGGSDAKTTLPRFNKRVHLAPPPLCTSGSHPLSPYSICSLPMNQPLTVHGFSDPDAPGLTTLPNGTILAGPPGWGGYFAGTYDWAGDWSPGQVRWPPVRLLRESVATLACVPPTVNPASPPFEPQRPALPPL